MTDQLRQVAQQALEALGSGNPYHQQLAAKVLRAALEQQAEPPPEWPLIKNILAVFGLDAISFVAKWQAAQQQATPPQRQWVGLTDDEILSTDPWEILRADPWMGTSDSNINPYQILLKVRTLEAKLKERNT